MSGWTCQRQWSGVPCLHVNKPRAKKCALCGRPRTMDTADETRVCSRCGERRPIADFYFVSKKLGTRRGQCKDCMSEVKRMQKDPDWRPSCSRCGEQMVRFGPGRRLCQACFDEDYETEDRRTNGSHRLRLKPCSCCGAKRLRADHIKGASLCGVCRSVSQSRRQRLRRLYNMTPRDFLTLLEDQGHACAICVRPFTRQRVPHVDHRHSEPMLVRGIVCATCNTILGLAKDNADRLAAAAKYLDCPPAQFIFRGRMASPEANRGAYRPMRRAGLEGEAA